MGRIAVRGAKHSRLLRAGFNAAQTTLRSFLRVVHLLFLQITGVFFCIFAVGFAARIPHAYQDQLAGRHGVERTYLLVILTALFAWFGVSSFWRARSR